MRNLRFLTVLSAFPLLLSSCSSEIANQPDVFAKEEIAGAGAFAELTIKLDSENKKAKVIYPDAILDFTPVGISLLSSRKEFVKEVKNEIGIKSVYEDEYFFYEVKLNDFSRGCISYCLDEDIRKATKGKDDENARTLKGLGVQGVGFYVKRSLYEGKPSSINSDIYCACALLGEDELGKDRSYYYDGNGLHNIVSRY